MIIILTGHGDFGDKDICSPSSQGTVCCGCTEEFIVKTRGILERQCFPIGVKAWLFIKRVGAGLEKCPLRPSRRVKNLNVKVAKN